MNAPRLLPILICILAMVLPACATRSTVHSRIAAYPDYFEKLSDRHRDLVRQNRVTEGMSKEAVYLAWGKADEIKQSSHNHKVTETWIYLNYEPVYSRSIGVGYGYGGSRYYGYRGCNYGGYGNYYGSYGTDVSYRPYVGAKVEFEKDRVVLWETARK